jgi:hypothetical protein
VSDSQGNMESAHNLINARIAWCLWQRGQDCTDSEAELWRAEEDGLRDALLNKNYTDAYRLSTTEVFRRYVRGLRDGRALYRSRGGSVLLRTSRRNGRRIIPMVIRDSVDELTR